MSLNIGIGIRIGGTSRGFSFDDDLLTYTDGLTTPLSQNQMRYINTFIVNTKLGIGSNNLSDLFDVLYYLGNETPESSLRNMVKRAHDATAVNSPTFTPYEGFTGDGISSYIDTNYNPTTNGIRLISGNGTFGVYLRTERAASTSKAHGVIHSNSTIIIYPYKNTNIMRVGFEILYGLDFNNVTITGTSGMSMSGRSPAIKTHCTRNKTHITAGGTNGVFPNYNMYLGAANNQGSANLYDDVQISLAFTGKHFTIEEKDIITDIFEALMDANGKGVIT